MTYFKGITLRNPITLQAIGNWGYSGQLYQGTPTEGVRGGTVTRRGTYHVCDNMKYRTILQRGTFNSSLTVSTAGKRTEFLTNPIPQSLTKTSRAILSMDHIDSYLWVLGYTTGTPQPYMFALGMGEDPPSGASALWTDRSGDSPYSGSPSGGTSGVMRRASDGSLYYLTSGFSPAGIKVMKAPSAAVGISTGFSSITPVAYAESSIAGYNISVDGSIQMLSTATSTALSTNGGISWSNSMNFGVANSGPAEFVHCPEFGINRWCCSLLTSAARGLWWSNGNGGSWTRSTFLGGGTTTGVAFSLIEKLDPMGQILLGFTDVAPLQIYISLNGGKEWAFVTSILPPYFDILTHPEIATQDTLGIVLVNDGSRISVYWPGVTGDEAVFTSDMYGLPAYYRESNDPRIWSP